jgi:ubiquitin C-terminal hydrolase
MPSITIEKDDTSKISIPETLTIHVNKNCVAIQTEKSFITYPASKITEFHMDINRQLKSDTRGQAYDNSYVWFYVDGHSKSIRTGSYTEEVYTFILKNLYDLDLGNDDDESVSTTSFPYPKLPASVYSRKYIKEECR